MVRDGEGCAIRPRSLKACQVEAKEYWGSTWTDGSLSGKEDPGAKPTEPSIEPHMEGCFSTLKCAYEYEWFRRPEDCSNSTPRHVSG